jgi:predicted phage terminase large subunit-like protein
MERDPTYKANLSGKDKVTRERLLHGNWRITYGGNMFDPAWFSYVLEMPTGGRFVRYWDFAASEVKEAEKNDPDWTAGALCCIKDGVLFICDIMAFRETPGRAEKLVRAQAERDGIGVEQWWEEEKGSSGKYASEYMKKVFDGFEAHADPVSGQKVERAKPWSAWAEFGRVRLVRGEWNKRFLGRAGKFPDGKRDEIDAVSGAFKALVGAKKILDRYGPYHLQRFQREKEDFEKIQKQNIEVYLSLWADKVGGVSGGCYVWSLLNGRLRLYNDICMTHPTAEELAAEVESKLVVPITSKSGFVTMTKAIGNDAFFEVVNENVGKVLKREGVRVRPVHNYDENAAILKINRMFNENKIVVHTDCVDSDVQIKGWIYEKGKIAEGFPMARALCLLVNELRTSGRLVERGAPPPYTEQKKRVREQLKSRGIYGGQQAIDSNRQWEYLTR